MSVRGAQAASLYRKQASTADALLEQYRALKATLEAQRAAVLAELATARQEVASIYLPRLEAAALQGAEQLTGFRGFSRRDPIRAMENERHRLEVLVEQIRASESYQRREYLVGPVGTYTRALAEAQDLLAPWEAECSRFEGQEDFLTLYELGYDTPQYTQRWWSPSYWRYWARGDAICEALGLADFGDDVLPAYERARKPREEWRQQVAAAQAKVDGVHTLVQRHDQTVARLQNLPQIYLEESQQMLAEHLKLADLALLAQWAGEDRGLLVGLRKISGLQAKVEFLRDAAENGVEGVLRDLNTRRAKFLRKANKLERPKHAHRIVSPLELDETFSEKAPRYAANAEKLGLISTRVVAYNRYDAFELDNPPELWFHEFSGGKAPSRLTPTLRSWYASNPNRTPRHDESLQAEHLAAAAAAAAASQSDAEDAGGYLS